MEFAIVDSRKAVHYEVECESVKISPESLRELASRAQKLFKKLKDHGRTSLESIGFSVTWELFSGRDEVFSFQITSDKIVGCTVRELFISNGGSYAYANLDRNQICFVIKKND
jgi:hypothetical protein